MKNQEDIIFEKLNNIANYLDGVGMVKEASNIDNIMVKHAFVGSLVKLLAKFVAKHPKILLWLSAIAYGVSPELRFDIEDLVVGRDAATKSFMEKLKKNEGFLNQSAVRGIIENATLSDPEIGRVHQYLTSRFKAADSEIKKNNVTGYLEKRRIYGKFLPSANEMALLPEKIEAVSNDLNTKGYDDKTKQKYLNYIFEKTDKKKFIALDTTDTESINKFVDDSIRKKIREPISKSEPEKPKVELATPEQEERLLEQMVTLGYDYNKAADNIDNLVLLARLLAYKGVNIKDRDDIVSRFMKDKKFKNYKSEDMQDILANEFGIGTGDIAREQEDNVSRSVTKTDAGYDGQQSSYNKVKLMTLNKVKSKIELMSNSGDVDTDYLKRTSTYLNYPNAPEIWDVDSASKFVNWIDNQITSLTTNGGTQVDIDSEPTQQTDYNYQTREYETKPIENKIERSTGNTLSDIVPDSAKSSIKPQLSKQRWTSEQQNQINTTLNNLENVYNRVQNGSDISSEEATRLNALSQQIGSGNFYTWDEGTIRRIIDAYKEYVNG